MTVNLTAGICIAILFICCSYGYKVGFLRCIVRLISSVLIFGLSGFAAKYIGSFMINNTEFPDMISHSLSRRYPLLELMSDSLSREIIYGGAFFVVLILTKVLLIATRVVIRIIEKIPIFHGINKLLGIIPAAAIYFLVIWAVFYLAELVQPTSWGEWLMDQIHGSEYLLFIYDNNLLKQFLMLIRSV